MALKTTEYALYPLMLAVTKTATNFDEIFQGECMVWKIIEGEMLIRTSPTTLLQILCKFILDLQVAMYH